MITDINNHTELLCSFRTRLECVADAEIDLMRWNTPSGLQRGSLNLDDKRLKVLNYFLRSPDDGDLPPIFYALESALELHDALSGSVISEQYPHCLELSKSIALDLGYLCGYLGLAR